MVWSPCFMSCFFCVSGVDKVLSSCVLVLVVFFSKQLVPTWVGLLCAVQRVGVSVFKTPLERNFSIRK